jgi:hypothetical protein
MMVLIQLRERRQLLSHRSVSVQAEELTRNFDPAKKCTDRKESKSALLRRPNLIRRAFLEPNNLPAEGQTRKAL